MVSLSLVTAVIGSIKAGLTLLEERERNYPQRQAAALRQRVERIERDFYKEYNRPEETRSDALLDHHLLELRIVLGDFASSVRTENVPDK
jgi:hypothetical protein